MVGVQNTLPASSFTETAAAFTILAVLLGLYLYVNR